MAPAACTGRLNAVAPPPVNLQVDTPDEPRDQTPGLLGLACLFAVVGGYLDAYAYLAHGHVFANAQTGNVVFLALDASGGRWQDAARHLPPIFTFACGVAAAKRLGVRTQKRTFHATLLCQACEGAILGGLAVAASRLSDAWVVSIIAFVAALQNTSFSAVGAWSFNSAMTTGNLRNAVSGLVLWGMGRDPAENRRKAAALGSICLAFFVGAVSGGACTRRDGRHALWPCVALVAAGFVMTRRERDRRASRTNDGRRSRAKTDAG